MKKLLAYLFFMILFVLSGILYWAATHESFFRSIESSGLITNMYEYGDLYTHTHLLDYKEAVADDTLFAKFKPDQNDSCLKVYVDGDSYTQIDRMDYRQFRGGFYQHTFNPETDILEKGKRNILIYERTERYFRLNIQTQKQNKTKKSQNRLETFLTQNPNPDFFNTKQINDRIQYLLGNNVISAFFQELKAELNFSVMGYAGNQVYVSEDNHLVYLAETLDPKSILSPFCPITDTEALDIIQHINELYTTFKSYGFDEVYFSLIPDKIRVYPIDQKPVNTLFEILHDSRILGPQIFCLNELQSSTDKVFFTCDTHWNTAGMNVWLKHIDHALKLESGKCSVSNFQQ